VSNFLSPDSPCNIWILFAFKPDEPDGIADADSERFCCRGAGKSDLQKTGAATNKEQPGGAQRALLVGSCQCPSFESIALQDEWGRLRSCWKQVRWKICNAIPEMIDMNDFAG
jgi:hypothetical protein